MPWTVILSNDEIIKQVESDVSCWRSLVNKCKEEKLKIKDITFNNEHPHAHKSISKYFVIYDMMIPNVLQGGSIQNIKIGIGGFLIGTNKCRIKWYKVKGNPVLYTELVDNPVDVYEEFSIEAC